MSFLGLCLCLGWRFFRCGYCLLRDGVHVGAKVNQSKKKTINKMKPESGSECERIRNCLMIPRHIVQPVSLKKVKPIRPAAAPLQILQNRFRYFEQTLRPELNNKKYNRNDHTKDADNKKYEWMGVFVQCGQRSAHGRSEKDDIKIKCSQSLFGQHFKVLPSVICSFFNGEIRHA